MWGDQSILIKGRKEASTTQKNSNFLIYNKKIDLGVEIPVVNFVNHVIGTITIYDSGFVHKESTSCTN